MATKSPRVSARQAAARRPRIMFTASVVAAFAIVAMAALGFVDLVDEIREPQTKAIESHVLMAIKSHATPAWDAIMPVATDLGGVLGVVAISVMVLAVFVRRREYARAVLFGVSIVGAALLNLILKSVFMRERPDLWAQLVHETGYSFPSGHAMMSAALGVVLVVTLWRSRWRWWAIGFGLVYVLFVGFSRLYLGVHYPTDVMAGWLVSIVWVLSLAIVMRMGYARKVFRKLLEQF